MSFNYESVTPTNKAFPNTGRILPIPAIEVLAIANIIEIPIEEHL